MNILISGFGKMGCRHAQSLLNSEEDYTLYIIEPSDQSFEAGLSIIGASKDNFIRFNTLKELNVDIDFAISATCSKPRYSIMKDLIEYGIKYFLVEKVAFQSLAQFDSIIEMLEANDAVAYCNTPNRYYKNFIELKSTINNKIDSLKLNVFGGNNGIGCNAIHAMDLFEFLTESPICKSSAFLKEDKSYNRRGSDYTDVNGLLVLENEKKDQLTIYFDPTYRAGVTVCIEVRNEKYFYSARDRKEYRYKKNEILCKEYNVLFASELTKTLVKDIFERSTLLPTIKQARNAYSFLFKETLLALGKEFNIYVLCPIT